MTATTAGPNESVSSTRFRDVVLAHQRALQLKNGSRPRVLAGTHKFLWIAMREVTEGLVSWSLPERAADVPSA